MTATDSPSHLPLGKAVAVGAGNALEFYDFLTFSFFSVQISHAFFPDDPDGRGLLYTLATFGIGFFTRPFGGWLIGRYADRHGRRPAMVLTFSLMGLAMLGLALTPSQAHIGILAPILLLVFRLVQGFALGGEVGPATAYLVEAAPAHRRGLYVSIQYVTQDVAILLSGAVGFVLSQWLTPAQLADWGWRVALLLGVAVVPLGLWMRRGLPETLHPSAPAASAPAHPRVRAPLRLLLIGTVLLSVSGICDYVLDYITTFAQDSLHLDAGTAFAATFVLGVAEAFADLGAGLLSDRYGRRPVMFTGMLALLLATLPIYALMTAAPGPGAVLAGIAVLGILYPIAAGPMLISVTESLPMGVRAVSLASMYAVAMSVFGGSTQFVLKALIDATGSPLAPGLYLTGALAVGLLVALRLPESAPGRAAIPSALPAGAGRA